MASSDKIVVIADGGDAARASELARVKFLATGALVVCVAVLVAAKILEPRHMVFGFIAAFAEAATIGGLADWYAVVALFRRPMGLPIPHTAIIQTNQHRIADKLGDFIEAHFLTPTIVDTKLREIDFAGFMTAWLIDPIKSAALSKFVLRLLPNALDAAEASGLRTFITRRVMAQVQAIDIAPLAAGAIRGFVQEGRHQGILDEVLLALHDAIHKPETLAALRDKIRDELPTLLKIYRADAFLLKRVASSATSFLEDVRSDPNHAFRGEFDRVLLAFIDKLDSEPSYAGKLDALKRDLLARPELNALGQDIWDNVKRFIESNAGEGSSVLQNHLVKVFVEAGAQLAAEPEVRAEINTGIVAVLRSFIAEQKSGVSRFIADQMKSWDMTQLINLIEINVGKDLQYIRFNGMIIGGIAGLILHGIEVLFGAIRTFV